MRQSIFRGKIRFRPVFGTLLAWAAMTAVCASLAVARPSAMKLLPEETLLLVRSPNLHAFLERLRDTNGGRMVRDPQIAPFVERLYGSAGDLYTERLAEILGVTWEELQNLPQGEVAFAIVARRDGLPVFVLMIDQGEAESVAPRLLETARERLAEIGAETSTETIAGVEVTVIRQGDDWLRSMGLFEKENTIVASNDPGALRAVLSHWTGDGEVAVVTETTATAESPAPESTDEADETAPSAPQFSGRTLAENDRFVTIVRHCRRPNDPPPNFLVYADPIGLMREFGRNNMGLKVAMATFPALGIDGLHGVGATMTFAEGRYDTLSHFHLLLGNPRNGVMQVIATEPGDTTPQPWVFAELETYMTWHWNFQASFNTIRSLVDRFQFEGRTDEFVRDRISPWLGIDFENDVIKNLAGRVSWMVGYERPSRFRGQQSTIGFELVDPEAAAKSVATVVAKYPERFEERHFGDVTYQRIKIEWPENLQEDPPSDPFLAVMDGYFLIGGSCQLFERAIEARDGTVDRLADKPEYQQLAIEVQQETPGVSPTLWMYSNFEESLRQWYDLLTSEKTRELLSEHSEGNPFFTALVESMEANELPPFDVLARYAGPSIGVIYDTDTGYHGFSFAIRVEGEAESP